MDFTFIIIHICINLFTNIRAPKNKNDIYFFSAKHAALRRKSKDCLARNRDNVSEWGDMSIRELLFQWESTIKTQLSLLY